VRRKTARCGRYWLRDVGVARQQRRDQVRAAALGSEGEHRAAVVVGGEPVRARVQQHPRREAVATLQGQHQRCGAELTHVDVSAVTTLSMIYYE
jgi:hypothetical protein